MKAYAYVRVSTKEQDEEIQIKAITEFAKTRNITILHYYIDKGVSGSLPFSERPMAKQLLLQLEKEKPEAILVWSIDRLGRTMIDTLNTIITLEDKYNVKVISVKEEWLQTLDQNIRKLVLSVLAWVAEFERRRIRERQLEAWNQGKQKGRPRKLDPLIVKRYLEKYNGARLATILKVMRGDGYNIGYSTLRRYVKELRSKGLLSS